MTDHPEYWYSDDAATLGDRIAAAREAAGLTQQALADKLGVRPPTIDAWENDRKEPRANRLQTLGGLLGVSLRWLLTGVGDGPDDLVGRFADATEVQNLLLEMREVRSDIARASVRLGDLEKQLRKALAPT